MGLSNEEVKSSIKSSLKKIEKGNLKEEIGLRGFLVMNDIESKSLDDEIKARYVLGELKRNEHLHKKYSSFLMCGINKGCYDNSWFAFDEVSRFSEMVSEEHCCTHYIFNSPKEMEVFLLMGLAHSILGKKPITLVYHNKGEKNLSEFVSFSGNKILAGGLANDWGKSLGVGFFGERKLIREYRRELDKGSLIDYMNCGHEVNSINTKYMPLVNRVLDSVLCYKSRVHK